jgi:hypothetical protein
VHASARGRPDARADCASDLREVPVRKRHLRGGRGPDAGWSPLPQRAGPGAQPPPGYGRMVEERHPGHPSEPPLHRPQHMEPPSAGDEVLLDFEDVAAGHQTKLRWNDGSDWIWSTKVTHGPLVKLGGLHRSAGGDGRARPQTDEPEGSPDPAVLPVERTRSVRTLQPAHAVQSEPMGSTTTGASFLPSMHWPTRSTTRSRST